VRDRNTLERDEEKKGDGKRKKATQSLTTLEGKESKMRGIRKDTQGETKLNPVTRAEKPLPDSASPLHEKHIQSKNQELISPLTWNSK